MRLGSFAGFAPARTAGAGAIGRLVADRENRVRHATLWTIHHDLVAHFFSEKRPPHGRLDTDQLSGGIKLIGTHHAVGHGVTVFVFQLDPSTEKNLALLISSHSAAVF